MKKIIIFGAGQTAEIVTRYFEADSDHDIAAYAVHADHLERETLFGRPVVAFETIEQTHPPDEFDMFVAASYRDNNHLRAAMYDAAKQKRYRLVSFVSSKVCAPVDFECGENCLVLENQVIQPFAKIGNNVFVWGGVVLGHHSVVEDHCWLTSGASVGGNTTIGAKSFLGLNCTIGHMISIGKETFVGASTLITKSTEDCGVFIAKDTEKYMLDSRRFAQFSKMR